LLGWCSPEWKFVLHHQVNKAASQTLKQHVEPATIAGIMGMGGISSGGDGKWGTRGELVETKWAKESSGSA